MPGEPFDGFYAGRRVLVTGHNGFLGGWLTRWLVLLGAQVVGYSRSSTEAAVGTPADCRSERGDVSDPGRVAEVIDEHRPDVIVHTAAQALVPAGFETPALTLRDNVLGAVNVLDAALRGGVRAVALIGTPGAASVGTRDVLDPYSASKCAVAAVAAAYAHPVTQQRAGRSVPLGVTVVRPGVLLGGEWGAGRLLPTVARALAQRRPVTLHRPAAVRSWQHVLDAASGVLAATGFVGRYPEPIQSTFALGRPDPASIESVSDVVTLFLAHLGRSDWPVEVAEAGAGAPAPPLDCVDAASDLGWRPVWDTATTLHAASVWYRADPSAVPGVTDDQIHRYLADAAHAGAGWAARTPATIGGAA